MKQIEGKIFKDKIAKLPAKPKRKRSLDHKKISMKSLNNFRILSKSSREKSTSKTLTIKRRINKPNISSFPQGKSKASGLSIKTKKSGGSNIAVRTPIMRLDKNSPCFNFMAKQRKNNKSNFRFTFADKVSTLKPSIF